MAVAEKLIQSLEKKIAELIELSNELNRENSSSNCEPLNFSVSARNC